MATTTYQITPITNQTRINQNTSADEFNADILHLSNGTNVSFYDDNAVGGRVAGRILDANGAPVGDLKLISVGGVYAQEQTQTMISAAQLSDGNIVVVWSDPATHIVHYRIVDQNLQPVTPDTPTSPVGSSDIHSDVAALSNGGFVITYEIKNSATDSDIVARTYGSTGAENPDYIIVNNSNNTIDEFPNVIGLDGDRFALAHDRASGANTSVYYSVWQTTDDTAILPDTLLDNTGTTNRWASLMWLPGGFMIGYADSQYPGGNVDITTERFDDTGAPDSPQTRATVSADYNTLPIAARSPGGYVFVANQDNTDRQNYGSLLDTDGSVLTRDVLLDGGDGSSRYYPDVTWIDASHVLLAETNLNASLATGGNGSLYATDSRVIHVFRDTVGDGTAENLAFFDAMDNRIAGNGGNDTLRGNVGSDSLDGGAGDDFLYGANGNDSLTGDAGDDLLDGQAGADTMAGGAGNDTYYVDNAGDLVTENAGEGRDVLFTSLSAYTLAANVDYMVGTSTGGQYLIGNANADTIAGASGANQIYAGTGALYAIGGPVGSVIVGSALADSLYGGTGNDYMVGNAGNDTIVGLGGQDSLYGLAGNDYIVAGNGVGSVVDGGAGSNTLYAGSGADYMVGGEGTDLIVGEGGSDYLFGNAGNDTLYGGQGADYIYGNAGNDFIWTDDAGQPQSGDFIYVGGGTGVDTVADFTPGNAANHDTVVVAKAATGISTFAQVQADTTQVGIYSVVSLGGGDQLYLYNVVPSQLTANDFLFL